MEIISQHIRASNHRVVHLKLIQCYMSIMSIKMEGKKELCNVLFYFQTLKKKSYNAESHNVSVVVRARVGKEFPDTRQNERRIKFIRVGRGESLPAQQAGFRIVRESRR